MQIFGGDRLFGRRKFLLAEQSLLFSTLLAAIGVVDGGQYVMLVGLILGLYGGSNVLAKRTDKDADA